MRRVARTIVLEIVLTLALALVLLVAWTSVAAGSLATGIAGGARTLFFFGDIVFYFWIPVLVLFAIVRKRDLRVVPTLLLVAAGAVLNVFVVLAIGLAQTGRVADFVGLAVQAGVGILVAAAVVVPLVHLASRRQPSRESRRPS